VKGICPEGGFFAGSDEAYHLGADALDRDVERLEHACAEALVLAQDPEQDVLGADVVVLQKAGFLLGEDDHLAGSLCEALEHLSGA
jgi:hypothetical protein